MRNAFNKDVFREIINTIGRFAAIFAIVTLGVAFFAGIGATGLDMKITGDHYFDEQNLMDIQIVSTYGLNNNDIAAIRSVPGVQAVYPAYNIDAQVDHNNRTLLLKVYSFDTRSQDGGINKPLLIRGRMPQKANEAVTEASFLNRLGLNLGDSFRLSSGKDFDMRNRLTNVNYTVVGIVDSPQYISEERGSCSIGDGKVDCFLYIPEENFRQKIYSEAYVTIADTKELMSFGSAYKSRIDSVVELLEDVGNTRVIERFREITDRSYELLNQSEKNANQSRAETGSRFEDAYAQLSGLDQDVRGTTGDFPLQQVDIIGGIRDVQTAERLIHAGILAINDGLDTLDQEESSLYANLLAIEDGLTELQREYRKLIDSENLLLAIYAGDPQTMSFSLSEINNGKQAIIQSQAELNGNLHAVQDGLDAISRSRDRLTVQKQSLTDSAGTFPDAMRTLVDAETAVSGGYIKAYSGLNELSKQLDELFYAESDANREIATAFEQIRTTRKALDDLDLPEWFVLDRESNHGYSTFSEDSDKIDAISRVFPLIFFIVAALVSLTTMTRLVEERRVEIGTLKSLGYGNAKIMSKYVFYAFFPTLLGGLAGGYFGMRVFPAIIIEAYNMLYITPSAETPLHANYWVIGILMGTMSTVGATILACLNELRATPAMLMRPKSPKIGKKILFERITVFWRALSFIQKVTVRNIVRYKKRFFMTVIGIAGCTALLVTGFGLRDSIVSLMDLNYRQLNRYDVTTVFTNSVKSNEIKAVNTIYRQDSQVLDTIMLRQKQLDASAQSGKTFAVTLTIPENAEAFREFTTLRDRQTHGDIPLTDDGVVLSEKLSQLLALAPGDTFFVKDGDNARIELRVSGIAENYFLHYIFMTPKYYESVFREAPAYNTIYTIQSASGTDPQAEQQLISTVLDKKAVSAVVFTSSIINSFQNVVDGLIIVVVVLIIAAGALAFIVLLNLTNINISERLRELATIEVLGFYDSEVAAYVYRENAVLTAIGAAAGLLMGKALHLYVILTAETDVMMFGRHINPMSYLYSVLLTVFFSVCVNMLTSRKLRRINMVEALKSIE